MVIDRSALRLSATLIVGGVLISALAGLFHPGRQPPNLHVATFTEYAASPDWTAVHLGQFVGMAVLVAGLLVLFYALNYIGAGKQAWVNRFAGVSAAVALGLYGVLQAVDGVALKQAVDAWAAAPEAEKAARFASAEAIRWLEWGTRSYQSFVFGLALVLFAVAVLWTARIPRPVGYLMGLSGLAYLVQGWVVGSQGFSDNMTVPTLLGIIAVAAWSVWLLISAWRMPESGGPRQERITRTAGEPGTEETARVRTNG